MSNARINIAYIILSKEAPLVEQMNSLGMSKADQKKYEELAQERQGIYKEALPHLQKVMVKDPTNIEAARTMMNIYYQINETEKAEEMKVKIAELETANAEATPKQ
jgi:Flp pilus assembly protein TadD